MHRHDLLDYDQSHVLRTCPCPPMLKIAEPYFNANLQYVAHLTFMDLPPKKAL